MRKALEMRLVHALIVLALVLGAIILDSGKGHARNDAARLIYAP